MNSAMKWGIILALAVTVFNPVWVLAGMHTSVPASFGYLAVVILLNIVAVIFSLKASASENSYLKQLLSGLVLGIVSGLVIFLTSWLTLTFVMPDMISEQIAGFTAFYEAAGLPEEQTQAIIESFQAVTPLNQASQGAMGTLFTSLIIGAIAGIFLRKK